MLRAQHHSIRTACLRLAVLGALLWTGWLAGVLAQSVSTAPAQATSIVLRGSLLIDGKVYRSESLRRSET